MFDRRLPARVGGMGHARKVATACWRKRIAMASASFVCGERRAFRASARYFATFVVIELVLKLAREPKTALENKRHRHLNPLPLFKALI